MLKKIKAYLRTGKRPSAITCGLIVLIVCTFFAAIALVRTQIEIREKTEKLQRIEEMCKTQTAENEALKELLDESTDEYIERRAREELGMVLPGERVYIIRAGS